MKKNINRAIVLLVVLFFVYAEFVSIFNQDGFRFSLLASMWLVAIAGLAFLFKRSYFLTPLLVLLLLYGTGLFRMYWWTEKYSFFISFGEASFNPGIDNLVCLLLAGILVWNNKIEMKGLIKKYILR